MKDTEFLGRKFSIDWAHFRYLWENNASEYGYYEMAKPYLSFEEFDKGCQYRIVNNENFL